MKNKKIAFNPISLIFFVMMLTCTIIGIVLWVITHIWFILPVFLGVGIISSAIMVYFVNIVIEKVTKRFQDEMNLIMEGDFSHILDSGSFGAINGISSSVNIVIQDIRSLIGEFFRMSASIVSLTQSINAKTSDSRLATEQISSAMNEIVTGSMEQASASQKELKMVEHLSVQIDYLSEKFNRVISDTEVISELNHNGLELVHMLGTKSDSTFKALNDISSNVEQLNESIINISSLLNTVENIAKRTNLIALNASIEASRAGNSGKEFLVVAQEIKALAEKSKNITIEIRKFTEGIQLESHQTIQSMEYLKNIFQELDAAVNDSGAAFKNIDLATTSINTEIDEMNHTVINMMSDKNKVLKEIENISAVSQETAASSQNVAAATELQVHSIEDMSGIVHELNQLTKELDMKLNKYKL